MKVTPFLPVSVFRQSCSRINNLSCGSAGLRLFGRCNRYGNIGKVSEGKDTPILPTTGTYSPLFARGKAHLRSHCPIAKMRYLIGKSDDGHFIMTHPARIL